MTQEEFQNRYQYDPNTDCLGEGGFGKVYKAYDNYRDRWVAIKMADVKSGFEQIRLKHEVELISKLPIHSNIAYYEECYSFSTFAGEYDFGVLQYYESGNLEHLLSTKQLSNSQKDSILRQILSGIDFLHTQGIIHRDLKPQNILVVNRNGEYIPKITDFGISKKLDTNKSTVVTNSLAGVGTLAYASPEQLRGFTIRKNTDLWSFGVLVCWMFTGKLPFNSGSQIATSEAGRIELFKQITAGNISAIIQQLPSIWCELVKQCIVVDYEKRISNTTYCLNILSGKINSFENKISVSEEEPVTDIDGNVYKTIQIGNQVWMAENLRVSRYRNGDLIPTIVNNDKWKSMKTGACCIQENDSAYDAKYGKLYNWFAVDDKRGLAPKGWHIATYAEWKTLINYLGGPDVAGGKLKETGTIYCKTQNTGETNKIGFGALLSGYRDSYNGAFDYVGYFGYWWSPTQDDDSSSDWYWGLNHSNSSVKDYFNGIKSNGYSVRCVKDSD